jgi:hypothetical protein
MRHHGCYIIGNTLLYHPLKLKRNVKNLKTKLNILIIILFCTSISKADLLKPNESILPSEVVKIQLTGLQKNDLNFKDSGIEQTWNFAHPK